MTATPDPAGVITPVLPLRQPPRRLLPASSTKAGSRSAASASSFRSRAADIVVRAPISPSKSACVIMTATLDSAGVITRSAVHAPPHWRSRAAEAKTADRLRSRQSGRELRRRIRRSSEPRPCPEGNAAKRQRLPRPLAATASLGGEAATARSPRAPCARVLSPQRHQKGADRHRSRQSGHLRARLPRAGNPATERRSSRPARGPPDVMSCDDRNRRCRYASSCVIAPELPFLPSPRRLLRASSTTASKRRAASTSLPRPSAVGLVVRPSIALSGGA